MDKYLADVRDRYGGVDAILLWPTCELAVAVRDAGMLCVKGADHLAEHHE